MDTSPPPVSEGGTDAPLALPERPLAEDHPTREAASPLPPVRRSASNDNESDSMAPDRLFGASEKSPNSEPPKAADLSEQRKHTEQASTPFSQGTSHSRVERGDLPRLRDLRVVGQIASGYILVDEPLAAWIVDQHVAHERAILDRLSEPEEGGLPGVQKLLVPEVVNLSPSEAATAAEALEELAVFGFDVEPFGKDSFRINGVISTLAEHSNVAGAFKQTVTAIGGTSSGMSREERILATIACHSAVKLGDRLAHAEMEALIKEWLTSRYPATCPHGRSICYRLEHKDIARKLDRH